jgi:predicted RNA-binding Zn-ribbon protein involved in translation (DUF1610 family)
MSVGLRELLTHDLAMGRLTHNPNRETSADRIGALGRADALGAALWRVLGLGDPGSFREAIELLYERMVRSYQRSPLMKRLCLKAIEEWLGCPCPVCGGRSHAVNKDGVRVECTECGGTGRGSHSHEARMKFLHIGKKDYAQLLSAFDHAKGLLSVADGMVSGQISRQLERRDPDSIPTKNRV